MKRLLHSRKKQTTDTKSFANTSNSRYNKTTYKKQKTIKKMNLLKRLTIRPFLRQLSMFIIAGVIVGSGFSTVSIIAFGGAQSIDDLRQQSSSLQQEIEEAEGQASNLANEASLLERVVLSYDNQIRQANERINEISNEISFLEGEIKQAEEDVEKQKELLKSNMRALYRRGGASTIELLAASDSFSDFIDEQEYLERLKGGIQTATNEVISLQEQMENQKAEQEELLEEQEIVRNSLNEARNERDRLLTETRGEERRYRQMVVRQQQELEELEERISEMLSAGTLASAGPISRGQKVGEIGSTGLSTGPHTHFMVTHPSCDNRNNACDPGTYGQLTNGYSWPVPAWQRISVPFGWVHCSRYLGCNPQGSNYSVFHGALDITANATEDIVAAADGELIEVGCQGGFGYTRVIDHGNGWRTWYTHMVTPSGQVYGYC